MNKRHYEHTLPNIRGSLSNTYNEAVLAPFYGGSFNVLSASGQKVFAKGK